MLCSFHAVMFAPLHVVGQSYFLSHCFDYGAAAHFSLDIMTRRVYYRFNIRRRQPGPLNPD